MVLGTLRIWVHAWLTSCQLDHRMPKHVIKQDRGFLENINICIGKLSPAELDKPRLISWRSEKNKEPEHRETLPIGQPAAGSPILSPHAVSLSGLWTSWSCLPAAVGGVYQPSPSIVTGPNFTYRIIDASGSLWRLSPACGHHVLQADEYPHQTAVLFVIVKTGNNTNIPQEQCE